MRQECLDCGAHTFRAVCGNCGSERLRPIDPRKPGGRRKTDPNTPHYEGTRTGPPGRRDGGER